MSSDELPDEATQNAAVKNYLLLNDPVYLQKILQSLEGTHLVEDSEATTSSGEVLADREHGESKKYRKNMQKKQPERKEFALPGFTFSECESNALYHGEVFEGFDTSFVPVSSREDGELVMNVMKANGDIDAMIHPRSSGPCIVRQLSGPPLIEPLGFVLETERLQSLKYWLEKERKSFYDEHHTEPLQNQLLWWEFIQEKFIVLFRGIIGTLLKFQARRISFLDWHHGIFFDGKTVKLKPSACSWGSNGINFENIPKLVEDLSFFTPSFLDENSTLIELNGFLTRGKISDDFTLMAPLLWNDEERYLFICRFEGLLKGHHLFASLINEFLIFHYHGGRINDWTTCLPVKPASVWRNILKFGDNVESDGVARHVPRPAEIVTYMMNVYRHYFEQLKKIESDDSQIYCKREFVEKSLRGISLLSTRAFLMQSKLPDIQKTVERRPSSMLYWSCSNALNFESSLSISLEPTLLLNWIVICW